MSKQCKCIDKDTGIQCPEDKAKGKQYCSKFHSTPKDRKNCEPRKRKIMGWDYTQLLKHL